jgi:hypothetical protein
VQLVSWYEIAVNASSPEEATAKAEAVPPARIRARGEQLYEETGLANPEFHQPLDNTSMTNPAEHSNSIKFRQQRHGVYRTHADREESRRQRYRTSKSTVAAAT